MGGWDPSVVSDAGSLLHRKVRDRVTDQVVHGSARRGAGLEEIVLGIPNQQALVLEGPADAPGQPLDE